MLFKNLFSLLFPPAMPSRDNGLPLPRLGESRPHGHFREFTVPRRYQRGGGSGTTPGLDAFARRNGIVPCTGENIP